MKIKRGKRLQKSRKYTRGGVWLFGFVVLLAAAALPAGKAAPTPAATIPPASRPTPERDVPTIA